MSSPLNEFSLRYSFGGQVRDENAIQSDFPGPCFQPFQPVLVDGVHVGHEDDARGRLRPELADHIKHVVDRVAVFQGRKKKSAG